MKSKAFTYFLLGAAIGAALGILYAPDKGINTREKLLSVLSKYREQLQHFLDSLANHPISGGPFTADQSVAEAKSKANQLLTDVDEMLAQMRAKNNEG